eukprot:scaffold581721_cov25-Prasinocladus_malaysianus.AAC.2
MNRRALFGTRRNKQGQTHQDHVEVHLGMDRDRQEGAVNGELAKARDLSECPGPGVRHVIADLTGPVVAGLGSMPGGSRVVPAGPPK